MLFGAEEVAGRVTFPLEGRKKGWARIWSRPGAAKTIMFSENVMSFIYDLAVTGGGGGFILQVFRSLLHICFL